MSFDLESAERIAGATLGHERRDRRTAPPSAPPRPNQRSQAPDHPTIVGRNDLGVQLPTGSIVRPTDPLEPNPSASARSLRRFLKRASEWTLGTPLTGGLIAVTLTPSGPGRWCECAMVGVAQCRVNMLNTAHPFARSAAGEYRWLVSVEENDPGTVPIVWREPGPGVVWARVALVEAVDVTTTQHCTFYLTQPFTAAPAPSPAYAGPFSDVYMTRLDGQLVATPQQIVAGQIPKIPGGVVWEPPDPVSLSTAGKAKTGRARRENNLWVAYETSCNEFDWLPQQ